MTDQRALQNKISDTKEALSLLSHIAVLGPATLHTSEPRQLAGAVQTPGDPRRHGGLCLSPVLGLQPTE